MTNFAEKIIARINPTNAVKKTLNGIHEELEGFNFSNFEKFEDHFAKYYNRFAAVVLNGDRKEAFFELSVCDFLDGIIADKEDGRDFSKEIGFAIASAEIDIHILETYADGKFAWELDCLRDQLKALTK